MQFPGLSKSVVGIQPQAISNTSVTGSTIDTQGFDYLQFDLLVGANTAQISTIGLLATNAAGTTFQLPSASATVFSASASNQTALRINVDLKAGGQYYRYYNAYVLVGATGTANISGHVILSKAENGPYNASTQGVTNLIEI